MRAFKTDTLLPSPKARKVLAAAALARTQAAKHEEWTWEPFAPEAKTIKESTEWAGRDAVETNYVPGPKRQDVVLVFPQGRSTDSTLDEFDARGTKYFYVDFDHIATRCRLSFAPGKREQASLSIEGVTLRLDDVAAVLWSQPGHRIVSVPKERHLAVCFMRWSHFFSELKGLLRPDVLWMPSHPQNGSPEWQYKLSEFELASRCGMAIPDTLYTNDPDRAIAFAKAHGDRVVFRDFAPICGNLTVVFTNAAELERERDAVRTSPFILQEYVEKKCEARVVLVGDKLYPVRIDSQASTSERGKLDWRVYDNARVKWERFKLPAKTERSLKAIAAALDVTYGAFDLICTPKGEWVFLELNRPGVSYWLNSFVGLDIAKEVAVYLDKHIKSLKKKGKTAL
jgi:glutathione synthase/RimK-type ligase-like ATP-grasp enzyme